MSTYPPGQPPDPPDDDSDITLPDDPWNQEGWCYACELVHADDEECPHEAEIAAANAPKAPVKPAGATTPAAPVTSAPTPAVPAGKLKLPRKAPEPVEGGTGLAVVDKDARARYMRDWRKKDKARRSAAANKGRPDVH